MLLSKVYYLAQRRREIAERVQNKMYYWMDRFSPSSGLPAAAGSQDLTARVAHLFQVSPAMLLVSDRLSELENHIDKLRCNLLDQPGPFGNFLNGTTTLGRLCYLACRQLRPRVVVETGVAYGVTSAYILQALDDNGFGELHSIDLPPLGRDAESYVGYFIPTQLKNRWRLRTGSSRNVLPRVLSEQESIDVFVHDSLHTYRHMKWEFQSALRSLRPGGLLISDDIEVNRAFEETIDRPNIEAWVAIREDEKNAICGAMKIAGVQPNGGVEPYANR
jgi:predicted O-methyltransferase YrrM